MLATSATSVTLGLIITFGGVGIVVSGLVIYIIAQALGERAENSGPRRGNETAV